MSLLKKIWQSSPQQMFTYMLRKLGAGKPKPPAKEDTSLAWHTIGSGYSEGVKIYVDPARFKGWKSMLNGNYDNFLFEAVMNHRSFKDAVIWDVGAHFGFNTMTFAKLVGNSGKVIAFEPNQHNIERFKLHLDNNPGIKNVTLQTIALSNENTQITFMVSDDVEGSRSTGSYIKSVTPSQPKEVYKTFREEMVTARTADTLVAEGLAVPHIMKIDVEGAEANVLAGATRLLKQHKPLLLIEVHNISVMHDVMNILISLGYITEILDKENASLSRCFIIAK